MSAELDAAKADLARDDTATWRWSQELSRAVAAESKSTALANMMVGDRIDAYLTNMSPTVTLLNGNASAAEAGRMIQRDKGFTSAVTDNAHIGDEYGNFRAAEMKLLSDGARVAQLEAVESRIAGSPELQRQEAAGRRVKVGSSDVPAQGQAGKALLTEQPITVSKPAEAEPAETQQRRDQQRRNNGLASRLLGLDS